MADEEAPPKPKPKEYRQIKFLVGAVDTRFGASLVDRLDNRHIRADDYHRILGTRAAWGQQGQSAKVRKMIDVSFFQEVVLDSDVIIYDLVHASATEAELVIKTLKMNKHEQPKLVVFISSVMVWGETPAKEKRQDEEDDGAFPEEPDSEAEGQPEPQPSDEPKKVYTRFTDQDFNLRRAGPSYQEMRSLQTLCLSINNTPNLKSYVLCGGIRYGSGEQGLYQFFKQAWLQDPAEMAVFGKGKNRIPMVHLQDLATYVQKIVQRPPPFPYVFGIDHNPKPTQKKLIEAISKGIGSGKLRFQEGESPRDFMRINLRLKPTGYFQKLEEEQAGLEADPDTGEVPNKFKFQWRCREGLQKNILLLNAEFNEHNKLRQIKVMVGGPPASGQTTFARQIALHYNIPYIAIKSVVEEVKALNSELGEEIRNALTEARDKLIEEGQAAFDELKEKVKAMPREKRPVLVPFNPEKVVPRLSDQLLLKVFGWRLGQNDCQNRGFVLDGYPTSYEQAKALFTMNPPVKEDDPPAEEDNIVRILNTKVVPDSVVILQGSDAYLIDKTLLIPEERVVGTHYTEPEMKRRLARYRARNNAGSGDFVLLDFFAENSKEVLRLNVENQQNEPLELIISFVEREGRFFNYKEDSTKEARRMQEVKAAAEAQARRQRAQDERLDAKQKEKREIQKEEYLIKKENEANLERDILDKKSLNLRKYLSENVVPILTEGITRICNEVPDNPVDFLAQFLFRESIKVKVHLNP